MVGGKVRPGLVIEAMIVHTEKDLATMRTIGVLTEGLIGLMTWMEIERVQPSIV